MDNYEIQRYNEDTEVWESIRFNRWDSKSGVGRNILGPYLEFYSSSTTADTISTNDRIRLRNTDIPLTRFEGRATSEGEVRSDGSVKHVVRGNGYEIFDKIVNFEKNYTVFFDGSEDGQAGGDVDDNFWDSNNIAVACWIRTVESEGGILVAYGDSDYPVPDIVVPYSLYIEDNTIRLRLQFWDDYDGSMIVETYDTGVEPSGHWQYIWFRVRLGGGNNDVLMYVDGQEEVNTSTPANADEIVNMDEEQFLIGTGFIDPYNLNLENVMDDVRGYTDYVPSVSILNSFMTTRRYQPDPTFVDPSEAFWYPMNEGEGDIIDASINENDLTLEAGASWQGYPIDAAELLEFALEGTDYDVIDADASDITLTDYQSENVKVKEIMRDIMDRTGDAIRVDTVAQTFRLEAENAQGPYGTFDSQTDDMVIQKFRYGDLESIINHVVIYTPFLPGVEFVEDSDEDSIDDYGERGKIYNLEYITTEEEADAMLDRLLRPDPFHRATIILSGDDNPEMQDICNREITVTDLSKNIDSRTLLIEEQTFSSRGFTELKAGKGSSWGIQENSREQRSNRWKE